jgi:hypothetical protein
MRVVPVSAIEEPTVPRARVEVPTL